MNDPADGVSPSLLHRLRTGLHRWQSDRQLDRAMRELTTLNGARPTQEQFERLWRGFGNTGWAATVDLLDELSTRVALANHGVLECGSGLTTMLLGALTKQRRLPVVTLEHHPAWFERMKALIQRFDLDHVDLQLRPLTAYADFDWYTMPKLSPSARFDLLLCDGPPGDTRGGRSGLLPSLRERMAPRCVLIVDDTHRDEDDAVVTRWLEELPGATRSRRGQFTIVQCP